MSILSLRTSLTGIISPIIRSFNPLLPAFQFRSVWQEVVRQIPSDDPQKAGQMTFEDVDLADMRIGRAQRAEG